MDSKTLNAIINESDCRIFGVRVLHDDQTPNVGDIMDGSVVWDDGNPTDTEIGGTCCFIAAETRDGHDIDGALRRAYEYRIAKPRYALLGGHYTGNNDLIEEPNTVAIRDAVVLATWSAEPDAIAPLSPFHFPLFRVLQRTKS